MLQDYIYMDSYGVIVYEASFYDDDIADKYCMELAKRNKEKITCYRCISEYDGKEQSGALAIYD